MEVKGLTEDSPQNVAPRRLRPPLGALPGPLRGGLGRSPVSQAAPASGNHSPMHIGHGWYGGPGLCVAGLALSYNCKITKGIEGQVVMSWEAKDDIPTTSITAITALSSLLLK